MLRYQLCAVCVRRPLRCTLRALHCCDVLRCASLCIAVQGAEAVQFAAQLDIVHGAPSVSLFRGGAVAAELARQPDLPRRGTLYIRMVNVGRKYDRQYTCSRRTHSVVCSHLFPPFVRRRPQRGNGIDIEVYRGDSLPYRLLL